MLQPEPSAGWWLPAAWKQVRRQHEQDRRRRHQTSCALCLALAHPVITLTVCRLWHGSLVIWCSVPLQLPRACAPWSVAGERGSGRPAASARLTEARPQRPAAWPGPLGSPVQHCELGVRRSRSRVQAGVTAQARGCTLPCTHSQLPQPQSLQPQPPAPCCERCTLHAVHAACSLRCKAAALQPACGNRQTAQACCRA